VFLNQILQENHQSSCFLILFTAIVSVFAAGPLVFLIIAGTQN
jgi:energy-coupling factor transporter transmembrane protein EcfT